MASNSSDVSHFLLVSKSVCHGIILVSNLICNTISLLVIHRVPDLCKVTKLFITSMNLSSLGGGIVNVSTVFGASIVNYWPFGVWMCHFCSFSCVTFIAANLASLSIVNLERFIAVVYALRYNSLVTATRAKIVILLVWTLSILFAAADCFFPGRTSYYSPTLHTCIAGPKNKEIPDIFGTVLVLCFSILPFSLTCVCLFRLYLLARFHANRIATLSVGQQRGYNKSELKLFTTFFIMILLHCLGFIPLIIVFFYENITRMELPPSFVYCAEVLALSTTVSSVVVYKARNDVFRKEVARLCCKPYCK